MKKLSFLLLVVMAVLFVNSCASAPKKREIPTRKITLEELQSNDGTAWVAVDGVVYDVTHNKSWCCGSHHGIRAGQDLTERIKKSPHGHRTLENLPIVGKLDDGKTPKVALKTEPKVEAKPAPAPVVAPVVEPKPESQPEVKEEVKEDEKTAPAEEAKTEVKEEEKKEEPKEKIKEEVKEEPKK